MPISMQPDLQHEQLLPLAPSAAVVPGLGNQSTRTPLLCSRCPAPAVRQRREGGEVSRGWSRWWERQAGRNGGEQEEASRGGEHRQKRGGQE